MITVTRKYFEALLDYIESFSLCKSKNIVEYINQKFSLNNHLKKIKQYNLLKLNLSESFYECLESQEIDNFDQDRLLILSELIYALDNAKIHRNPFLEIEPNYYKSVELSISKLPLNQYLELRSALTTSKGGTLATFLHKKAISNFENIVNEQDYKNYKAELLIDKSKIRFERSLNKISDDDIRVITNFFNEQLAKYKSYIIEHYPQLKEEFRYFKDSIRIYLLSLFEDDKGAFFRLYTYPNISNEEQLKIYPYYVDFASYEFENIEEIEAKIRAGFSTYFKIDEDFTPKRNMIFSELRIYQELTDIFIRNSDEESLKKFFVFLYKCKGYKIHNFEGDIKNKIDFKGEFEKKESHFKLLNERLKNIQTLKKEIKLHSKESELVFVSRYRIMSDVHELIKSESINFISLHNIAYEHLNNDNGKLLHWYIKENISEPNSDKCELAKRGELLINRLDKCEPGIKGWAEYEEICTEIFNFLFSNDFRRYTYRNQSYTKDGIFRRDLIVNNNYKNSTSFWAQVKADFNSNVIIVDFKNYKEPLKQNEFYLPSKYLNIKSGNFGLLFTRNGLSGPAKTMQQKMFTIESKLLLELTDTDLKDMVREKIVGEDVSYRMENKKFLLYEII